MGSWGVAFVWCVSMSTCHCCGVLPLCDRWTARRHVAIFAPRVARSALKSCERLDCVVWEGVTVVWEGVTVVWEGVTVEWERVLCGSM